jgi:hypothetical protein
VRKLQNLTLGGSAPPVRRGARLVELLAVFVGVPLALAFGPRFAPRVVGPHAPVLPTLILLGVLLGVALARDPRFDARRDLVMRWPRGALRRVLLRFVVLGGALTGIVAWVQPEALLRFPRERPGLFALVVVGYPLLSVVPQELAYRLWFRHRYGCLVGRGAGFVAASAAAFGFAHIVFWSWQAVALTAAGGVLFAATFRRTGSLGLVSLEHALYGVLVFTLGLGEHFYGGTVQLLGG